MLEGAFLHEFVEAFERDEVRQEDVCEEGGDDDEDAVFEEAAPKFGETPGGGVELLAGC